MQPAEQPLNNVRFTDTHPDRQDGAATVLAGLRAEQKYMDPRWFYDADGSALFEQITDLPEYYLTRTERAILADFRQDIARYCGAECIFIEPGAGSLEKVRLLLDALRPACYAPLDISSEFLLDSAMQLGAEFPWLQIHAVCTDFNQSWDFVDSLPAGKRVVFYPGSTLGNLEPAEAVRFLANVAAVIGDEGGLLLGADLYKSHDMLNAAYNDAQGVTASFNLNLLERLNAQFNADFNLSQFRHRAFFEPEQQRIEMHLVSTCEQTVNCAGETVSFAKGETIHTENSYKYSIERLRGLASDAGLSIDKSWFDAQRLFGVHYLTKAT